MNTTILFDFNNIKNMQDFYNQCEQKFSLPKYFGRNLDALKDFITVELYLPAEIEFINLDENKQNTFETLINMLQDIAEQELPNLLTFKKN